MSNEQIRPVGQSADASNGGRKRTPLVLHSEAVINELMKTLVERGRSYADYEENADVHINLMNVMRGETYLFATDRMTEKPTWAEGVLSQIASKMSRISMWDGHNVRDNWVDIAGYAILATAILDRAKEAGGDNMYEEVLATQGTAQDSEVKTAVGNDFRTAVTFLQAHGYVRRSGWASGVHLYIGQEDGAILIHHGGNKGVLPWLATVSDVMASDWIGLATRPTFS